ncbi:arginine N-succinyltransferase [Maricaulis sp.]|uniref:arginine N-succinyltransferase n=1 Tax=unclassified Maricaulis TaxID=2632371 RepID=UPI001B2AC313|nr:arginine N-succinyltransferase [Maricaulis sp.]MBO6796975.1 arginine N-succinyltransferase [Maricaulis sp.]
MLIVRAGKRSDIDALIKLAAEAGTGFTSLALPPEALEEKLIKSEKAFGLPGTEQTEDVYQLMLEDTESGQIVGCSAVKAMIGVSKPYWDFKIITLAQHSSEADRRFDMDALLLVNDFAGATEVGTLFVSEAGRGSGAGRLVAQSRYLLIAAGRPRFGEKVVAELRGVVEADGSSPFFDHVSRPFFRMDFDEADALSAATDNQFILDLGPQHLLYVDLLPKSARDVIGQTHRDGGGARRLLEWEGFHYDRYIDIFDGGPLVSAWTENIRTLNESREVTVRAATTAGGVPGIVSTDRFDDFRTCQAHVVVDGDVIGLSHDVMEALNLTDGDRARFWRKQG